MTFARSRDAADGVRIVSMYFAIVYVFPLVGNWWLAESIISSYDIYPLTVGAVAVLVTTYLLFRALVALTPPARPADLRSRVDRVLSRVRALYGRHRLALGLVAVPLALENLLGGLTSFRYALEGIASRETVILPLMMVISAAATADLFYFMFVRDQDAPLSRRRRFESLLLSASLVIAANGIAMLLLSLCTFAYAVSPTWFRRAVFAHTNEAIAANFYRVLVAVPAFVLIFVVAWYAGTVVKLSSNDTMSAIWDDPTRVASVAFTHDSIGESLAAYAVERPSVFYYAFLFTEDAPRDVLANGAASAIVYPLQTMFYRLDLILGQPFAVDRPPIGSIMQLNYLLTTHGVTTERGGTSPGLLAAFTYVLPHPFNVFACAVYLWWLAFALTDLFRQHGMRLSLLGQIVALQFLVGWFSSPFDWLILVDNEVLYLGLLYALVRVKRRQLSESCSPNAVAIPLRRHPPLVSARAPA
jgi:hypothetical protein